MGSSHLNHQQIVQFIEKGKELVSMKAISEFEAEYMLDKLQSRNLNGAIS